MTGPDGLVRLEVLPRGITGFRMSTEPEYDLPRVDEKAFKAACFLVARILGSHQVGFDFDSRYHTFYAAALSARDEAVLVLCNKYLPHVCFVSPDESTLMDMRFLSPPSIQSTFAAATDFKPFDPAWLASDYSPKLISQLGKVEIETIRYWRPSQLGDTLFNGWD